MQCVQVALPQGTGPLEFSSALESWVLREELPPGWTVSGGLGRVRATLTGRRGAVPGTRELAVTLTDDHEDLQTATVSLDGRLLQSATRENRQLVDLPDAAVAYFSVDVPSGFGHVYRVSWESEQGPAGSHEFSR